MKEWKKPFMKCVLLEKADITCTSITNEGITDDGNLGGWDDEPKGARSRNAIFGDE